MAEPFRFYTEFNLPLMLGRKASCINELVEGIKSVPASSIYFHTHRFLKQHRFLVPEPPNDFAYWLRMVLNLREIGELISSVNIVGFSDIEELRRKFVEIFEKFRNKEAYSIECPDGYEFQFMSCRTFWFPLSLAAANLSEFAVIIEHVPINAFYYHIFSSRLRRGRKRNDFADWFESIGEAQLAEKISAIDPYTMTLEGLRANILKLVKSHV